MTVTINGKDARATWGIVFDSSAISALMTPAAMKPYIENSSRTEHGKRVVTNETLAKLDARTVNLTFCLCANSEDLFFTRYSAFCDEIQATGKINIVISSQPNVVYRLLYKSCTQFTQYNNRLAKFNLKCEETNPKDREPEGTETDVTDALMMEGDDYYFQLK